MTEGMKWYRLMHRVTSQFRDVEAASAQEACQAVGWLIGDVWVREHTETRRDPKSESGFRYPGWKNVTPRHVK